MLLCGCAPALWALVWVSPSGVRLQWTGRRPPRSCWEERPGAHFAWNWSKIRYFHASPAVREGADGASIATWGRGVATMATLIIMFTLLPTSLGLGRRTTAFLSIYDGFFIPRMKMKESKNLKIEVAKWQMANGKRKFSKIEVPTFFKNFAFAICHFATSIFRFFDSLIFIFW